MNLKLASFNVENLKIKELSEKDKANQFNLEKEKNKEEKCEEIAEIIQKSEIDIIALQEIQNEDAVKTIKRNLPSYDYCHCGDIYDLLNALGFRNRHEQKFKNDYAFIWNTQKFSMCRDPEVYKKLHFQTKKCWDRFIQALVEFIIENTKGVQGKICTLETFFPGCSDTKNLAEGIASALRETLRPPLIACFRPAGYWNSLLWELRMINTHVQWTVSTEERNDSGLRKWLKGNERLQAYWGDRGNMEVVLRQKEMEFIQGDLYTAVNTCRNGDNRSVYTVVAGDFNMSVEETSAIYGQGFPSEYNMTTIQRKLSHWNKKEKKLVTSYDHFAFDFDGKRVLTTEQDTDVLALDNENRISDHNPVTMEFKF